MNIPLTIPHVRDPVAAEPLQWTQSLLDLFAGIRAKRKVFSTSANLTEGGFRVLTECMYSDETYIEIDILAQEDGAYTVSDEGRSVKKLQAKPTVWSQAQDWDVYMRSAMMLCGFRGFSSITGYQLIRIDQGKVSLSHLQEAELSQAIALLANAVAISSNKLARMWDGAGRTAAELSTRKNLH